MNERKDRLAGMVGGAAPEPAGRPGPARRALLYAPAPTPPAPWLALLQQEGLEVLVATSPEAASALLDGAGASLIVVLAPVMGEALREVFRKKAPGAEVRVVPGLG
ncbi:MAG TPA: hypothetical protein VFO85_07125, partial [Vicinamibacteria bacterium]|nr:hypothetical protein [Vicinamibacteria bacterium]